MTHLKSGSAGSIREYNNADFLQKIFIDIEGNPTMDLIKKVLLM